MSIRLMPSDDVASVQLGPAGVAPAGVADPLTQTVHSLAIACSLGVVARLGIFGELANGPVDIEELAGRFALQAQPLRIMLDVLAAEHYLHHRGDDYELTEASRQWLDPRSPTSVVATLAYTLEYWKWWSELDQVAAGGAVAVTKPEPDDKVGWLRMVRAYYEYARLIGDDVADSVELPRSARSVLDLGSGHGWLAAVLCRRHPRVRATVVDDEAAVAIGRELIWEAGLEELVTHQAGDIFTAELGGPYDAAVCFPLLFSLDHSQTMTLLNRLRAVLRPGGLLIAVRPSPVGGGTRPAALASTELFLRLASRPDPSSRQQFDDQLAAGGFAIVSVHEIAAAPQLSVYVARAG